MLEKLCECSKVNGSLATWLIFAVLRCEMCSMHQVCVYDELRIHHVWLCVLEACRSGRTYWSITWSVHWDVKWRTDSVHPWETDWRCEWNIQQLYVMCVWQSVSHRSAFITQRLLCVFHFCYFQFHLFVVFRTHFTFMENKKITKALFTPGIKMFS